VAGHAVHRLLVGSRGGLGVLLEASLKLLPGPPARRALVAGLAAGALADPARWAGFARREPAVLTVLGRSLAGAHAAQAGAAPFALIVGFEDDPAWVEDCAVFARARLSDVRAEARDADVPPLWRALADAAGRPGPRLTFASAHNTPAALAPLLGRPVGERLLFHAPSGRLVLWPLPAEAADLVRELAALGFALVDARGADVDLPASTPSVRALRERLSAALDPAGTMAFGPRWRGTTGA
jgi:FAD/FMN-containing dehydrogenase